MGPWTLRVSSGWGEPCQNDGTARVLQEMSETYPKALFRFSSRGTSRPKYDKNTGYMSLSW